MAEAHMGPQAEIDSVRECVEKRKHLYGDKPWEAHIGEGILRFGGADVVQITDFIHERYGVPGSEQGVEEGEGLVALYLFVKLHLMDAGIIDITNNRIPR